MKLLLPLFFWICIIAILINTFSLLLAPENLELLSSQHNFTYPDSHTSLNVTLSSLTHFSLVELYLPGRTKTLKLSQTFLFHSSSTSNLSPNTVLSILTIYGSTQVQATIAPIIFCLDIYNSLQIVLHVPLLLPCVLN